jgi:hypothetical protein
MRIDSLGMGLAISILMFVPVWFLDFGIAFNPYIGNGALALMFLPYLIYLGIAAVLRRKGYGRLGKGLAIGGGVFSTLILIGIFLFFALAFSAATEFG